MNRQEIPNSVKKTVQVRWLMVYSVILGLIFAGCGGGGGGATFFSGLPLGPCTVATQSGNVTYTTFWGNVSSNASQVIQIVDVDGFVVRTDSVNRNGQLSSSISIPAVQAGVHKIISTLYTGPNATGGVVGTAESVLDMCISSPNPANTEVTTTNAEVPTAITVSVGGQTITQQQTLPFVASPNANGRPVFIDRSLLTWNVTGGVGTVDSEGTFTAVTPGTGSVTASYSGLLGSASVSVDQKIITQGKWTVLVYLNAANDLYSFSTLNMNQMEEMAGNPDVRFVVQWKQSKDQWPGSSFDGVRRYLAKFDTTDTIASELVQSNLRQLNGQHLDMGDPQTLNDFIKWGKQNYPADRYVLVLWNHGNGWKRGVIDDEPTRAFSYDDQFGTSIKTWQTDQALAGEHFDIIAWDASLMQMIEVAYEARSYADYIVGSEESPPGEGYPYHLIFDEFRDNPDASTAVLSKSFVDGMLQNPIYVNRKITQSVLDTTKLANLATKIDALALQLIANKAAVANAVDQVRDNAQSYSPASTRVYRDLYHICELLEVEATVPASVKTACVDVRMAITDALVWEGHNAQSINSNGIAIDFSDQSTFGALQFDYLQLKFATDTNWNEWLGQAP